ncbi:hypothetical protein IEO21_04100 [Rhodonia placenta]|uniref:F-box domain-containing protein n=1 Tax=Rhodonia placenta TaxID=104341 RepID=A0A8H7P4E6_9APHY|nr:hypothetical protein IEO21_04100 [Postia placenta]
MRPADSPAELAYNGPRVPIELCEQIIDHLHDEHRSLSACSLACRSWVSTVRSIRFRHVCLATAAVPSFLALLQGSPTLGAHVRSLLLNFAEPSIDAQLQLRNDLDDVMSHLHAVETLRLESLVVTPAVVAALGRLLAVTRLEVGYGLIANAAEDLTALVRSFARLTQLQIRAVPFAHRLEVNLRQVSRKILDILRPHYPFEQPDVAHDSRLMQSFYKYLLRGSHLSLGDVMFRESATRGFIALLEGAAASTTLEELSVNLLGAGMVSRDAFQSSRIQCKSLRRISLYQVRFARTPGGAEWIIALLSQVATNAVQTIVFEVEVDIRENLDCFTFMNSLTGPLAHDNLRGVERFDFMVDGDEPGGRVEGQIRGLFPDLDARGLLAFQY